MDSDLFDQMQEEEAQERINPVNISREMKESYLAYAISVIVDRALPDVRDGLKPVHRRIIYGMLEGGYKPSKGPTKSARIVGEVMGNYHPHGDASIYDALVRLAQPWAMRYPLVFSHGNFGSPSDPSPAAMRYTECCMNQLSLEMVRDIDKDAVDFVPNYDGQQQEPTVLPSRFPNLLVNGSAGIAVGMATNIPTHNLREVAEGIHWVLDHPQAGKDEILDALISIIHGPDFPTGAQILGRRGIEEAYRTGRGAIVMRAKVKIEEIDKRTCLVITELPYQVNPDRLMGSIVELIKAGVIKGIADMEDSSNSKEGLKIVLTLKRDAVPKVVLNNLFKHTQLQTTFGANMLALVDGVPRTLSLDRFVCLWIEHQMEVIRRRTAYTRKETQKREHLLLGLVKAASRVDEVVKALKESGSVEEARGKLKEMLEIDDGQADGILSMQLRQLASLEREKIVNEHDRLTSEIEECDSILSDPEKRVKILKKELDEIVSKFGDDRRTEIVRDTTKVEDEDLIEEKPMVYSLTRSGYIKATSEDEYKAQHRGGKGVKGASLSEGDLVDHFISASNHDWLLFFTNMGRLYKVKGFEIPESRRDAKGQHIANVLQLEPGEKVEKMLAISNFDQASFLVLATKKGKVKKTALSDYANGRKRGIIAISLTPGDELIGAGLCNEEDDLIFISEKGMSIRFSADNEQLRPLGRQAAGVQAMKLKEGDEVISMKVVPSHSEEEKGKAFLLLATSQGFAKKTSLDKYKVQFRNGYGTKAMSMKDERGSVVGAVVLQEDSDIFMPVLNTGKVIRFNSSEIKESGRVTQGVKAVELDLGDEVTGAFKAEADL
ncbi:MAG: DNA gyrase subunit A [Aeriscardovia sp.]|nr:DNA gyrase subunit A [Aeriscardovia sp.]